MKVFSMAVTTGTYAMSLLIMQRMLIMKRVLTENHSLLPLVLGKGRNSIPLFLLEGKIHGCISMIIIILK